MGLVIALKAFWKALRDAKGAEAFLQDKQTATRAVDYKTFADKAPEERGHLALLALLQREGRLVDFIKEEIDGYDDAQIGAAVREVHRSCRQCLEEAMALRPIMDQEEGSKVTIPQGYDSARIKVVGNVRGEPPYQGVIVHRGWRASKKGLAKHAVSDNEVIAPAEVEIR